MSSDIILETRGLVKEFKGFVAVNDVNLKVRRGTIHALIGPNGAGKTTCFNLLTKFLEPTRGQILFDGHDITRDKPADIARRGVCFPFFYGQSTMEHVVEINDPGIGNAVQDHLISRCSRRNGKGFSFFQHGKAGNNRFRPVTACCGKHKQQDRQGGFTRVFHGTKIIKPESKKW